MAAESSLLAFSERDEIWRPFAKIVDAKLAGIERDQARMRAGLDEREARALIDTPRPAHFALARLQKKVSAHGGSVLLCTDTIDDLHEQAGVADVVHLRKASCGACHTLVDYRADMGGNAPCPRCGERDLLVNWKRFWDGARVPDAERLRRAIVGADLLVAIGSDLHGSSLIIRSMAHEAGVSFLLLNPTFDGVWYPDTTSLYGPLDTLVPAWVADTLAGRTRWKDQGQECFELG